MRRTKYVLFLLCAIWTVVQMVLVLLEFLGLQPVRLPSHMPLAYYLLLGVYAVVKEGARWLHKKLPPQRGEWFFLAWWVYALILFTVSAVTGGRYAVPELLCAYCVFVSLVYVGSSSSKLLHGVKRIEVRITRTGYRKGVSRAVAHRR